jgi:outer membrane protein TolC
MLLEARTDAREAERVSLRETTNRFTQQTALFSELLQQQSGVSQAEAQYQQALQQFWTARAEFEKAIGAS